MKNEENEINEINKNKEKRDKLYAISSRIKYIIDSKEKIWGCLDAGDYLEATRRLLRARVIYEILEEKAPQDIMSRFSFLPHIWKSIQKLRENILNQIHEYLSSNCIISTEMSMKCICALSTLEKYTAPEVLKIYINDRKAYIQYRLSTRPSSEPNSIQDVSDSIISTLLTIINLFLRSEHETLTKMQQMAKSDDLAYGSVIFSNLDMTEAENSGNAISELKSWNAKLLTICDNLAPLNVIELNNYTEMYMNDISAIIETLSFKVMTNCAHLSALHELENKVKFSISNFNINVTEGQEHHQLHLKWNEILETVLNTKLDIWTLVFEKPVQKAILHFIQKYFNEVYNSLLNALSSSMHELDEVKMEQPWGTVDCQIWSDAVDIAQKLTSDDPDVTLSKQKSLLNRTFTMGTECYLNNIYSKSSHITKMFNEQISLLVDDILNILSNKTENDISGNSRPTSPRSSSRYSGISGGSRSHKSFIFKKSIRSRDLENDVQEVCESFSEKLSKEILIIINNQKENILNVILMSSVAMRLSESCPAFSVLLGPSEDWRPCGNQSAETPARSRKAPSSTIFTTRSKFRAEQNITSNSVVLDKFKAISLHGFSIWAQWASKELLKNWMESIKKCNYHINTRKSRTWENIKFMPISSPNETLELSNMSFSLPSMPSTETTSMLLNACLEISRIGGHSTNIQIVKLYGFELSRAICHTFQSHITQNLSKIHNISGDDGILQFILDFHFLRNLLSGSCPVSPVSESDLKLNLNIKQLHSVPEDNISLHGSINLDPVLDPYVSEQLHLQKHNYNEIESELSQVLDPIDWATYEPYLWTIEQKCQYKTSVLFGSLSCLNLNNSQQFNNSKFTMMTHDEELDTNMMGVANVVPRFQYLPIRMPQVHLSSQLKKNKILESLLATPEIDDPTWCFSFANIGTEKLSDATNEEKHTNEEISTFTSLQEKFQTGSFGNLGLLFSDTAAEVTAIAQQRFGDFLQPSGLSTANIFSTFKKSVGKATGKNQS